MRDIRGDLQERANLLEQQINTAQAQFEKLIEHFKREAQSSPARAGATPAVSAGLLIPGALPPREGAERPSCKGQSA